MFRDKRFSPGTDCPPPFKQLFKTDFRMNPKLVFAVFLLFIFVPAAGKSLNMSELGLHPGSEENATQYFIKALKICKEQSYDRLIVNKGRYDFYPCDEQIEQLNISAHDHQENRYIGLSLHGFSNLTIDCNGSDFVFHGMMLPFSFIDCTDVCLKNVSIDFATPYYTQALITQVRPDCCDITFDGPGHAVDGNRLYMDTDAGRFEMEGFMVFDNKGKFILPDTGDLRRYTRAEQLDSDTVRLYGMDNACLHSGDVMFMRNHFRPNPGIFSWRCKNSSFHNINIYWAQGMGMLAQRCENIDINRVNVCLRPGSKRCFTTIDALHFTECKGKISIKNGLYENMMDDALNVHGDYLQIQTISPDRKKMVVSYKHHQSFGYESALPGEDIQFISRKTMLPMGNAQVAVLKRLSDYESELYLNECIPDDVSAGDCIENLNWCPEICYKNNTIRNNRARGILVSSPLQTIIEHNTFDHCSGSAILLSSDCNSWFLSGACHDVRIKGNRISDCMTSAYQYCEGIFSIYPEMPQAGSEKYHSNIKIERNFIRMGESQCVLFAKSVKGLSFVKNKIDYNGIRERKAGSLDVSGTTGAAETFPIIRIVDCEDTELK